MRKISLALANAFGVGLAMTAISVPSFAQTAQTTEKIEVTGSSIKRVEGESALPVTVITRQEIERSGATTPMELLNLISANNSLGNVALTSTIGASTLSAQTASLRGLQGAHTLVLINGKRVNGFAGEIQGVQGVNLAIVPFAAIERVEILKDGASAVYGSDAIGGVINFILRSDYRGAEASVYYGAPTRSGGGEQEKYSASFGFGDLNRDRYNVFFSASYDHQKALDQRDRDFARDSTREFLQLGGFAGSSNTFPGNITTGGIGVLGGCTATPDQYGTVFVDLLGGCFTDPATVKGVNAIPDDKLFNVFVSGKLQLTSRWQAYATGLYSEDKNRFIIQPTPISNLFTYGPNGDIPATILLPATSPYYPHAAAAAAGVDGQPLNIRWRAFPTGLRDTTDVNKGGQVVVGIKGSIADRWDTDVSYSYAQGKTSERLNNGFVRYTQILPLLNSGQINLFGPATAAEQALIDATKITGEVISDKATTKSLNAKISGDLFNLRSGAVAGAVGIDFRKEELEQNSHPGLFEGDITGYGGGILPVAGSRDIKAAFAEVVVPVLKNLEVNAAIRTDEYSDFGRTNNPKFSIRYQPNRNMLLRTSYGKGFLAPSLYQLFLPQQPGVSATGQTDPIRCPVTNDTGLDCNTQFGVTFGGNPALKPEKSEQFTAGIVLEPNNAFSVSADYFKIRLNNGITNGIPVTTILGDLAQFGGLVTRAPADPAFPNLPGRILAIDQTYVNLGATHIEGWDVEAHYKWPQMRYGRVRLDVNGTYYTRYDGQNLDGSYSGFISNAFGSTVTGVIPRWKHYAALTFETGPWAFTAANTYQASYRDWQTDLNGDFRQASALSLWDLQGQFTGFKNLTLTLGVKNVLDTNPPKTNQQVTFQAGYDPSYYDARARFVYGMIRYEFR
jgi:iron complex outermembrane receptor protein